MSRHKVEVRPQGGDLDRDTEVWRPSSWQHTMGDGDQGLTQDRVQTDGAAAKSGARLTTTSMPPQEGVGDADDEVHQGSE